MEKLRIPETLKRIFLKRSFFNEYFSQELGICIAGLVIENVECISSLMDASKEMIEYLLGIGVKSITLSIEPIDVKSASRRLEAKLMTYRVILERNPDNKQVEAKMNILSRIYRRIVEGHAPLKARYVLVFKENPPCNKLGDKVSTAASLLKSHGCEVRLVRGKSIIEYLLGDKVSSIIDSRTALEPLEFVARRASTLSTGIYIGKEVATRIPIHVRLWDDRLGALHMLVLGPTGKGKTTFLASLAARMYALELAPLTLIDPKGDLARMMSVYNFNVFRVDKVMLTRLLCGVKLAGIPLSSVIEAGLELSDMESRILDTNMLCLEDEGNMYSESVRLKLELADIDVTMLCSCIRSLKRSTTLTEEKVPLTNDYIVDLTPLSSVSRSIGLASVLGVIYAAYSRIGPAKKLRRVLIVDEAWRFTRRSKLLIEFMVKEFRSLGVSLVMSTQDPEDVPETLWNNIAIVVAFGSHDREYIEKLARVLKLDQEDALKMRWLSVGEAMVKLLWDPRPLRVSLEPEPEIVNKRPF